MGSPDTYSNFSLQELSVVQFPLQKVCSRSLHRTPEMGAPDPTSLDDTLPTTDGNPRPLGSGRTSKFPLAPILLPVLSNAAPRLKSLQPLIPLLPTTRLAHEVR